MYPWTLATPEQSTPTPILVELNGANVFTARLSTGAASVVAMAVSFLDAQLTFCTLQHAVRRRLLRWRAAKAGHGHHGHGHHGHAHHSHDHTADSEYIILPRVRPSTKGGYEQYTRSWVFDVDGGSARQGQGQGQGSHGVRRAEDLASQHGN